MIFEIQGTTAGAIWRLHMGKG